MSDFDITGPLATCADDARYPELWEGLLGLWVPAAGITGDTLYDVAGGNHGAFSSLPLSTWGLVGGVTSLSPTGTGYIACSAQRSPLRYWSAWIQRNGNGSSTTDSGIISQWDGSAGQSSFALSVTNTGFSLGGANRLRMRISTNGTNFVDYRSAVLPSGVVFVEAIWNGSAPSFRANGAALNGALSASSGTPSGEIHSSSYDVSIGNVPVDNSTLNATLQNVMYSTYIPSAAESRFRYSVGPTGIIEPAARDWAFIPQGNSRRRRIICGSRV